ncbi:MAG TPA: hypothetical protein VGI63_03185 [Verrucomicrobiae bacterium]
MQRSNLEMRTCPYCGKKYADDLVFCPIDQRVLMDNTVHWENNEIPEVTKPKRWVKISAAGLAFLPMIILILATMLHHKGILSEAAAKPVIMGCVIFNFPAFSIVLFIKTFNVSWLILTSSALILMFLWSSFLAWFFWKVAATFLGEEEPETTRGQYDWAAFRIRFFIGFVVGFLCGWRFVKEATSMKTVLIASIITGLIGGFLYGITRPPDFWSRS